LLSYSNPYDLSAWKFLKRAKDGGCCPVMI
jgi:hypothetical protein